MTKEEHYHNKYNAWSKAWKKDVKELGYSRMNTDKRLHHVIILAKELSNE